ncbi:MAG: metallophosphoesterase [Lachnospiraceae bacterium]|nr:metallophosphoesterase [Lachnospiraceae bacterium]
MKVLVIPDVHLKPWMFERARGLMKKGKAERAICLMDIADDWRQEFNLDLYMQSYDAAIAFAKEFSDTLWCYGNHDVCYPWNQRETGYSRIAPRVVCEKLRKLEEAVPEGNIAFIHKIDNVLFMHGGLTQRYVEDYVSPKSQQNVDAVIAEINTFGYSDLWLDESPLWFRPQYERDELYRVDEYLQVVGHTPVERILRVGNLISCDVFSTDRNRIPIGTQEFLVIDTKTWEFEGVK